MFVLFLLCAARNFTNKFSVLVCVFDFCHFPVKSKFLFFTWIFPSNCSICFLILKSNHSIFTSKNPKIVDPKNSNNLSLIFAIFPLKIGILGIFDFHGDFSVKLCDLFRFWIISIGSSRVKKQKFEWFEFISNKLKKGRIIMNKRNI